MIAIIVASCGAGLLGLALAFLGATLIEKALQQLTEDDN